MKNIYLKILVIVLFITTLSSCLINNITGINGNGIVKTEIREIAPYKKIKASGAVNIYISQGDSYSLKVESDENLLEFIETYIKGDELVVEQSENFGKTTKLNIYVTVKELSSIDVSGACDITSQNMLSTPDFDLEISGSSDVSLILATSNLNINVSGASDINLKGKASKARIESSGASTIKAFEFVVRDFVISTSGASDMEVNVVDNLNVDVSGASTVRYKGSPTKIDQNISGAGSIKKVD